MFVISVYELTLAGKSQHSVLISGTDTTEKKVSTNLTLDSTDLLEKLNL